MNCIDTDTALSIVQALGDDTDRKIEHLATCPACRPLLAELSALNQTFSKTPALSEDLGDEIYQGIQSAPRHAGDDLAADASERSLGLALATFLASIFAVLGIALFPGVPGLLYTAHHGQWARLLLLIVIGLYVARPALPGRFNYAMTWRAPLQWR